VAANDRFDPIRAAIAQLGPADHACTLYERREDEAAIAAWYIRAGLDRGEFCVCVVDDGRDRMLAAIAAEGVDVVAETRRGRLVMFENPLAQGFETQDMVAQIEAWASGARDAGHAGFRIVGEMTWALGRDLTELAQFEARLNLNRVWERHACAGLCQFDARVLAPETLREMIMLHPLVIVGDRVCRNPYYVPPERYLAADWPRQETDWMLRNLERLQEAQDSLRVSQERYRSLSRRLIEEQEQVRRSLARELHDQLGQSLVAVAVNLTAIKDDLTPQSRERIPESMRIIEMMIKEVQTLAFELRPTLLDDVGLAEALSLMVARHGERTSVRATFTCTPANARAPTEIETACFRIVQEALSNVARHANARNLEIALTAQDGILELVVRDDGMGFDFKRLRNGLGIVGMRERAELAGGQFAVESAPGDGTTLRVRFLLPGNKMN
jgi:signal transduction histidine kinase